MLEPAPSVPLLFRSAAYAGKLYHALENHRAERHRSLE